MYTEISTYLDLRITEVNSTISGTDNDFVKIDISLDSDLLSENQKDKRYMLKIDSYEETESEAPEYLVDAVAELKFIVPNGDTVKYQPVIDTYIHRLVRQIQSNRVYEYSSSWGMEVKKVSAKGLNSFSNDEMSCEILMQCRVIDSTSNSLTVPSAPTLTAPTDGYASGLLDQSFNWTGTADSWEIKIYIGSTVTIQQAGLTTSSYTVPLDSLLTDATTYSWTVRGTNGAGTGAWATPFTFTTNDVDLPATPTLNYPANGGTVTTLTPTLEWNVSARADTYEIVIASDSGFSSILTTVTGLTTTYYEYTFSSNATYYWKVRATNSYGSSSYSTARSVIVSASVPDYTTNLVAKWRADTLLTSDAAGVSSWTDSIGSVAATQSTDANKPVLVTNYINGKPAVYFNNNNHYLSFTPQTWGTHTIFIVYKATSFTAGDANVMIGGTAGDVYSALNVLSGGYGLGNGSAFRDVAYNASDTNWGIRTFQATKVFKNKTEAASYRGTGTISTLTVGTIGKRNSSLYPFKGYIAEIRVYNAVLTQTQINSVSDYLNSQYAIY